MKYEQQFFRFCESKSNLVDLDTLNEIKPKIIQVFKYLDDCNSVLKKQNTYKLMYQMLNSGVNTLILRRLIKLKRYGYAQTKIKTVIKYGKIMGIEKWNSYLDRQAYTNSLDYYKGKGFTIWRTM
jgi:hypothetical protein